MTKLRNELALILHNHPQNKKWLLTLNEAYDVVGAMLQELLKDTQPPSTMTIDTGKIKGKVVWEDDFWVAVTSAVARRDG